MTGGAQNIHLSRSQPELGSSATCSGTIECALAGVADHVLVAGWLLLLVAVAFASLVVLPRARKLCTRERDRVRSEQEAFDRFIQETRGIATSNPSMVAEPAGTAPLLYQQANGEAKNLADVRQAYRETVMSVPHFAEDYNEGIREHMGAELGEEIAHAATAGSTLSPQVKRSVLRAAADARDRREEYLQLLEEEMSSLQRHGDRIKPLAVDVERIREPLPADQSFDSLRSQHRDVKRTQDALERIVAERQTDRTNGRLATIQLIDGADLQEYLYAPLDVTYPVLAEASRLVSQLDVVARRVEDELIYRA